MGAMSNDRPFMQYSAIIGWFYDRSPAQLHAATERFFDELRTEVDPTAPTSEADHLQMLFHEWFLFDYRLRDGRTPLEFAAGVDGGRAMGLTRKQRDDLAAAAHSQVTAVFWVVGASAATHLVTLENIETGERYDVYDVASSGRLDGCSDGMIACRLVHVRGRWYMAGNPVTEMPVKPTERMRQTLREDGGRGGHPMSFMDLIRIRYGRKSDASETSGTSGTSGALGTSYETIQSMTPQALVEFKNRLRMRYLEYRTRYPELPEWIEVFDAIGEEDGRTPPMDVFRQLFGNGGNGKEELPFAGEREFRDFTSLFTDLWNVLPHRALDGLSPNEAFAGQQRIAAYRHAPDHPRPWLDRLDMIADPTSYGFAFDVFPRVKPYAIMGVERKDLEDFAKDLAAGQRPELARMRDDFLADLPHFYFEENALHAMLIGRMAKDPDTAFRMLDAFLPYVNNRKICECLKVPALHRDLAATYRRIEQWIFSARAYTVRFAIITLMREFKGTDFDVAQAWLVAGVTLGNDASTSDVENDVKLAREWYFGVKLVEVPDAVIPLFEEHMLPKEIHNAALRRAMKSKRIDNALRERLRGLIIEK